MIKMKCFYLQPYVRTKTEKEEEFHTLYPKLRQNEEREPIATPKRLAITLRFLATGYSLKTIGYNYRIYDPIVDYDYKFICVDIGGYGKNSDGGIFEASSFGQRLSRGSLNIPSNRSLPGQNEETPCVLIGDEAFASTPFLMRPFSYRMTCHDTPLENYDKHLCRARRVVENAFGIIAQK
ncbi:hypothetical protein JTB14_002038 [Gonioctena quinquepunctata]|nr:hypothetical protein JTB14_002038 [Gonioctena quinquepunctata]